MPPPPPPSRILFLRPDAYGDLFLFEPVLRLVRAALPQAEVAVLIRAPYGDAIPLVDPTGTARWLTTACNPYRQAPGDDPAALDDLRRTVREFAPDCLVAACAEQTWLEPAVAAWLPGARQICLGDRKLDLASRAALDATAPVDWAAIYPEKVLVERDSSEWEKNLRLAGAVMGAEAPRWWPVAHAPEDAQARAAQILAENGLAPGAFVACAAAGTANVQIKSWPAAHYGDALAWLQRERGVRALLVGHASEREHLETVRRRARGGGVDPALWLGRDGEMPVLAGLLAAARFYFGNDTGALHLAAALGRPVVSIFGGGHWPRFRPVARREWTLAQPLPCFGCAWDCLYVDAPCVRTISPDAVRRALDEFLQDDSDCRRVFEAPGLDAGARALIAAATPRLRFLREDSADRLRQIQRLTALATEREGVFQTEAAAHRRQIEALTALLKESEADRDARLRQVQELTALLKESETDRDARLRQVEELTPLLLESEADRAARGKLLGELAERIQTMDNQLRAQAERMQTLDAHLREQAEHIQFLTAKLTPPPASGTP